MNDTERVMTVGQAAHASGLTPKAVRLCERRGLLTPIERSHAGNRQCTDNLARLVFIRQVRSLGLHLDGMATVIESGRRRPFAGAVPGPRRRSSGGGAGLRHRPAGRPGRVRRPRAAAGVTRAPPAPVFSQCRRG